MKPENQWTLQPYELPVFFRRNRVFRVYQGGKLFSDLLGDAPEDNNLPEEWIASAVRAINPGHTDPLEGISLREEDGKPFSEILQEDPEHYLGNRKNLGVLVKYLDSAIRLPMQAHPTRAFAREHFGSPYGKAESWLILATRPGACIYFGFREAITKEDFARAVEESETNKEVMTALANRVEVQPGDVFFIDAGRIHAIGAGCLILEVQEPTDFTIQPEYWCGDYHLNDQEMYMDLTKDTALDCFNYELYGPQVAEDARVKPRVTFTGDNVTEEQLIGPRETRCFQMNRYRLTGGEIALSRPASIWIVTEGEGRLTAPGYERPIHKGDYFFLPAAAAGKVTADGELTLISCEGEK